MKTWLRRTLIGAAGATVLIGGLAACAHRDHHARWRTMSDSDVAQLSERLVDKAGSRLELDAAQKAKLTALATVLREQRRKLVDGGDPRAQWAGFVAGPTFDRTGARAWIDAKTGAVQGGSAPVIDAFGEFYDSLRPPQQAQLRELMARGRRGWHG